MRRPIWDYSVCLEEFHRKFELKFKITPNTAKNESGLVQLIMMGKSIRQIWVNVVRFNFLRMFAANEKVFKLFFLPLFFDSKIQHKTFENKINIG